MICRCLCFLTIFPDQFFILTSIVYIENSDNTIQWCANIMRHISQKNRFCLTGLSYLLQCFFKETLLLFFLFCNPAHFLITSPHQKNRTCKHCCNDTYNNRYMITDHIRKCIGHKITHILICMVDTIIVTKYTQSMIQKL